MKKNEDLSSTMDNLVARSRRAAAILETFSQEQIDHIVHGMAMAALDRHIELAALAVKETGRGVFEDKAIKNLFASEYVSHHLKYLKTVGVIAEEGDDSIVAAPVGVVAGITPVTNPTATTIFKSLIALKAANAIIFGFHPSAQGCSAAAAQTVRDAAVAAGAPADAILWIEKPSIEATSALMRHPGVDLILATGGSGMVRAAYSTGKPALGVGPGNVPCFIERSADLERAVTDILISKTFDHGMICASEQTVIIDEPVFDRTLELFSKHRAHLLNEREVAKLTKAVVDPEHQSILAEIVGSSAVAIAHKAGIKVAADTKVLLVPLAGIGPTQPFSKEKLCPILGYCKVSGAEEGIAVAEEILDLGGLGHSAVIHARDQAVIAAYSKQQKAGRIIVNSPATQGAIGNLYNTNAPSLTLGCGSFGHNSTTQNVSANHLINLKRVCRRKVNMQWFKVPEKIFFERGSIGYLEKMPGITRAFVVTDPAIRGLGYVTTAIAHLRLHQPYVNSEIFSEVEPDPTYDTVLKGVEQIRHFQPDVIIAIGGGSAIDAAKAMWLLYEYPDVDLDGMRLKFMNIRKRAYKFPHLGKKAQFVAVPTTSGTGSEVTAFAVITDARTGTKYPLADYELTPDVAIVDAQFVDTLPRGMVADTGIDTLTHAVEAYVSAMASDYTDGLALQAITMVFSALQDSYQGDLAARERMHNAATIAGMAFTNAFLGVNHAMAHQLGAMYHIPHGRANAVLLPYVIAYNGVESPTKFIAFPKYEKYCAHRRYQDIARQLGLAAATPAEGVQSLVNACFDLMRKVDLPTSIADCGVDRKTFVAQLDEICQRAFADQCLSSNPRYPLVEEIRTIFMQAYDGKVPKIIGG